MNDSFVPLKCPGCGAKLEVHADMERFACGYCGSEILVQRRGGTVALKAVIEGIRQVQKGTDRTAAELALTRLEKELQALRQTIPPRLPAPVKPPSGPLWKLKLVVGAIVGAIAVPILFKEGYVIGVIVAVVVMTACVMALVERPDHESHGRLVQAAAQRERLVRDHESRIARKEDEIAQTRRILGPE